MNQDIFVRQWGAPEIDITLENLKKSFSIDFLPSTRDTFENDPARAWVYEKMDMFILFRKGNLIAHFKWSEFKERSKRPISQIDSGGTRPPSLIATTLSLFT